MDQLLTRCGGIFDLMQCCRQKKKRERERDDLKPNECEDDEVVISDID